VPRASRWWHDPGLPDAGGHGAAGALDAAGAVDAGTSVQVGTCACG
jgi:hypothetical protein